MNLAPLKKPMIKSTYVTISSEQIYSIEHEPIVPEVEQKAFNFQTDFKGYMEMLSDIDTVAEYLDAHEGWFCRCAQPMTVEPIGNNGYTLIIGRFGSFGYEVEPKISVILEAQKEKVYHMHTIPIPDYQSLGYDVDYQAVMTLEEMSLGSKSYTKINWELHLKVAVIFPKFIYKLPNSLIQNTGNSLLAQIVRQISPRLTYKVQKDFHDRLDLPIPPKNSRYLEKITLPAA